LVGAQEAIHDGLTVLQLIEKPEPTHAISHSAHAKGIVGRYLLQPAIFDALRELKGREEYPLHLTAALELLREAGQRVYAFELRADRQDIGEVLGQANEVMGASSDYKYSET
jgi:UTP-glucose-1-phosphate uridylyltransferase